MIARRGGHHKMLLHLLFLLLANGINSCQLCPDGDDASINADKPYPFLNADPPPIFSVLPDVSCGGLNTALDMFQDCPDATGATTFTTLSFNMPAYCECPSTEKPKLCGDLCPPGSIVSSQSNNVVMGNILTCQEIEILVDYTQDEALCTELQIDFVLSCCMSEGDEVAIGRPSSRNTTLPPDLPPPEINSTVAPTTNPISPPSPPTVTTASPTTLAPTSVAPTMATPNPTVATADPTTLAPTLAPTTDSPTTSSPTTLSPTVTTGNPSANPTTLSPTTLAPTPQPTNPPTRNPTKAPTETPTALPTQAPTQAPTTSAPTTSNPTARPGNPTAPPTTAEPTPGPTAQPTKFPTKLPTPVPTTRSPTPIPTTGFPTQAPTTARPTTSCPVCNGDIVVSNTLPDGVLCGDWLVAASATEGTSENCLLEQAAGIKYCGCSPPVDAQTCTAPCGGATSLPDARGLTCESLVGMVNVDGFRTCSVLTTKYSSWCECNNAPDPVCSLCPNNLISLSPEKPFPTPIDLSVPLPQVFGDVKDLTCQGIEDIYSVQTVDTCADIGSNLFGRSQFDLRAWCECPGVPPPTICGDLCVQGTSIPDDRLNLKPDPELGLTCSELEDRVHFLADSSSCSTVQMLRPLCCGETPAPTTAPPTRQPTPFPTTATPTVTTGRPSATPTTATPTNATPTTGSPTTATPTTMNPTVTTGKPSATPTTARPTTDTPTTMNPTTISPTTSPTTVSPTTASPTTRNPTMTPGSPSAAPTTASPTTDTPTTGSPTTAAPTTASPTTTTPTISPGVPSAAPTTRSPTKSPTMSPTLRTVRVNSTFQMHNTDGLTSVDASQPGNMRVLNTAWANFVEKLVLDVEGQRRLRSRRLEVNLIENTAKVGGIIDVACPTNVDPPIPEGANCQNVTGRYELILTNDEDPEEVQAQYTEETAQAIEDGKLQEALDETAPNYPFTIVGPATDEPGGGGLEWWQILLILSACLFCVGGSGLFAVFYLNKKRKEKELALKQQEQLARLISIDDPSHPGSGLGPNFPNTVEWQSVVTEEEEDAEQMEGDGDNEWENNMSMNEGSREYQDSVSAREYDPTVTVFHDQSVWSVPPLDETDEHWSDTKQPPPGPQSVYGDIPGHEGGNADAAKDHDDAEDNNEDSDVFEVYADPPPRISKRKSKRNSKRKSRSSRKDPSVARRGDDPSAAVPVGSVVVGNDPSVRAWGGDPSVSPFVNDHMSVMTGDDPSIRPWGGDASARPLLNNRLSVRPGEDPSVRPWGGDASAAPFNTSSAKIGDDPTAGPFGDDPSAARFTKSAKARQDPREGPSNDDPSAAHFPKKRASSRRGSSARALKGTPIDEDFTELSANEEGTLDGNDKEDMSNLSYSVSSLGIGGGPDAETRTDDFEVENPIKWFSVSDTATGPSVFDTDNLGASASNAGDEVLETMDDMDNYDANTKDAPSLKYMGGIYKRAF